MVSLLYCIGASVAKAGQPLREMAHTEVLRHESGVCQVDLYDEENGSGKHLGRYATTPEHLTMVSIVE